LSEPLAAGRSAFSGRREFIARGWLGFAQDWRVGDLTKMPLKATIPDKLIAVIE
jgi:hypothetical protein